MKETIIKHLSNIESLLKIVVSKLDRNFNPEPPTNISHWLDSVEVEKLLKISTSTLYRLRKKNILNPYQLGSRNYYDPAEIQKHRDRYLK